MNLGGPEILVIIVVAILILGPDKLPNALRMFGRTMGEVKKYQDMAKTEIDKAMKEVPDVSLDSKTSTPELKKSVTSESDEPFVPILDETDESGKP